MLPQESALSEHHLLIFLVQVLLLLGLARACGEVLRRWGHPPLVGEILGGVFLGPTLLGRLASNPFPARSYSTRDVRNRVVVWGAVPLA